MFDTGLRGAVAALEEALDLLAAVDLDAEDDRVALDATVAQQRLANRLAAEQTRLLGHVDRRDAYRADAAVTLASWYRTRTRLDHGEAARRVKAAQRLTALPRLAAAFAQGAVTAGHVTAVTDAAVPQRAAAINACQDALVTLALKVRPHDVKVVVGRIRELADPDGTHDPQALPDCGPDPRRYLELHPTIDGLVQGRFLLDQIDGEALRTALEAADVPDPADIPPDRRRSHGQRRADALAKVVHAALDAGSLPDVQGSKPHVLLTVDLATLTGDGQRPARLRFTGDLPADRARHLALRAAVTVVLTMGPWRIVNVGRRFRTLPPWLRQPLEVVHRHCRGPDCDRPITWTQAHHGDGDWSDQADTDLNTTIPLCKAHHDLVTVDGWTARFDHDTGTVTWTRQNRTINVQAA